MRSILLAVTLLLIYVSALPGTPNYVAPSNSTRVLRQTSDSGKNLEDILGQRKEDSEDVEPLGEVQLDVEEEDIGEAAEQKMRVRRGYSGGSQQKSKYGGGGQSNKYGGSGGGNKYDGGQQKQQNQGGYGQQPASGGKYGGGQSQGGSGYY